ncbi:Dynamin-like GTPase that mediates homotypic ER fusion [Arthromyces matolae]|nr:Dynamin-like GTPase that mediates homotypic ER fusion [Arthromyces matolae]
MAVLFNPLYFTFLLIALASAYAIVQLGLVGPLYQVSRTIAGELQRQATTRLREHFSEPVLAQPVRARSLSTQPENDDREEELRTL